VIAAFAVVNPHVGALMPLHGIGGRQDLPLPFELVVAGAAAAVVASFVVLALAWKRSGPARPGLPLGEGFTRIIDSAALRWTVRGLGLAVAAFMTMALLLGEDRLTNPIFGFVYVWLWVGLVPISLLFGPFGAPLTRCARCTCSAAGCLASTPTMPPASCPPGPAVAGRHRALHVRLPRARRIRPGHHPHPAVVAGPLHGDPAVWRRPVRIGLV
jgi:hypothetical protein